MKKLHFDYNMTITFSEPVYSQHFDLRCFPVSGLSQQVEAMEVTIEPECACSWGTDAYGNRKLYGSVEGQHREFTVKVSGAVCTGITDRAEETFSSGMYIYKYPTAGTRPGAGIRQFFEGLELSSQGARAQSIELMHLVHERMQYRSGATGVKTTAEEAFTLGMGVCQDYTHILITLLRLAGLPARYVAGMVEGEGASHAWAEVYVGDGWYGLDATNDREVDDTYIRCAVGRDAADCLFNKGILTGGGMQTQTVHVLVEADSGME